MQSNIDLTNNLVSSNQGFKVFGASTNDNSGSAVSGAGDINGDGYGDYLIGAPNSDPGGISGAGTTYILFGNHTNLNNIYLSQDLTTNNQGFSVYGSSSFQYSGSSVSKAGDFNADGFGDVLIGAASANDAGDLTGNVYLIFGKRNNSNIDLSVTDLAASNYGFTVYGAVSSDRLGEAVSKAGDINGDGYDDIIIGAYSAKYGSIDGFKPGIAYIIFGKETGFSNIDLQTTDLSSTGQGFRVIGVNDDDFLGGSVASADINKDGYSDLIISADGFSYSGRTDSGAIYVLFGKTTGFTDIDLATTDLCTTNQGFTIFGAISSDQIGLSSAQGIGDINGDSYPDFAFSSRLADRNNNNDCGITYVIYVKSENYTDIDLAILDNSQGFSITGAAAGDYSGRSPSGTDVNNDGFDDLALGAYGATVAGKSDVGKTYIIFGKAEKFSNINLANFNESVGVLITGDTKDNYDQSGYSVSVIDMNGDGFGDVIIGANQAEENSGITNAGITYVVFGSADPTASPSSSPSLNPSSQPTQLPTASPSGAPSSTPTGTPSSLPSLNPTWLPSSVPSGLPSTSPSGIPTQNPTEVLEVESTNDSNFWQNSGIPILSSVIGGIVLLSCLYCGYVKGKNIWTSNDHNVDLAGAELSVTYAGEAGLPHENAV
jgi:hypothetical protein